MRNSFNTFAIATPALISPELAAMAFPKKGAVERDTRPRLLDKILKCWVCGEEMGYGKTASGQAYGCTKTAHAAKYNRMLSLNAPEMDWLALEAIQQVVSKECVEEGTAAAFEPELLQRERLASVELARLSGEALVARAAYERAVKHALKFSDALQDDMEATLLELKCNATTLEAAEAQLRAEIVADREYLQSLTTRANAFSLAIEKMKSVLPFRAETQWEHELSDACRAMLKSITLEKSGKETHNVKVVVRLTPEREDGKELERIVVFKDRLVLAWRSNIEYRNNKKQAKIKSAGGSLTDQEYGTLPSELLRYHEDQRYRQVLDAFSRETSEISFRTILRLEGRLMQCEHIIQHMLVGDRLDALEKHLRQTRGPAFRVLAAKRGTRFSELGHLVKVKHPVVLLAIARPGGPEHLSDAQWHAIKDHVRELKIRARYGDDHPRWALDRYFALLRSDLPFHHVESWHKDDKPFGSLVPKFRMGRHVRKLHKVVDTLLRMEGWALPKDFKLPLVEARAQKVGRYDETILQEIEATVHRVEPLDVPPVSQKKFVCGGLILNPDEESIVLPNGQVWHTAVDKKELVQRMILQGVKASEYARYANSRLAFHMMFHNIGNRLHVHSQELAESMFYNKETETYGVGLPVVPLT